MIHTSNHGILKRRLEIAIVISMGILGVLIFSRGGSLFGGGLSVNDFSLCEAKLQDGRPQLLDSLVLTPTDVVYGCGYLEVRPSVSTVICLDFYLNRGTETISKSVSDYCLPARSQYFSYPFNTTQLRNPGKYRLYVYDPGSRQWTKSVAFEISPNP